MDKFNGKLALQQRVLPTYRAPFFDTLAQACTNGLSIFAGEPRPVESINTTHELQFAQYTHANNKHIMGGPFYLCKQEGFIEWLEDWQPDALIVEGNPRYTVTPKAIAWMQDRSNPVLGWGLGAAPLTGILSGIRKQARLRLINSLDGIISYSQRGAAEYRALGMPADKVFVANNAAAPKPTTPPPTKPDSFEGSPIILFVGRLQSRKRLELLFNACTAQTIKPRLIIVGDGPGRAEFEKQAKLSYPQTEFLGAQFGDALDAIFRQADIFVLPGTGGLAIQQAMSHGLPVIVAQGDGTQDDLVREGNGWMVPAGDQTALNQTLTTALQDPAKLRQMGLDSYRITAEEINLEAMVGAFVRALNAIKQ